jgi:hypothetical protein
VRWWRRRLGALAIAGASAFAIASCTSSSESATTTTSTSEATSATISPSVTAALSGTINSYELAQGVPPGHYTIVKLQVSSVDPSWALFLLDPNPNTYQGGYGFLHQTNAMWSVTGFGTALVGCPPASAGNQLVPAAVLAGFDQACPPS